MKQVKVDLLFQANTAAAQANITKLSNLLLKISQGTTIGIDGGQLSQAVSAAQQLQTHLQNAVNVDTGKLDLQRLDASLKSAGTNLQILATQIQSAGAAGQQAFMHLATAIASAEAPSIRLNKQMAEMGKTLLNTAKWQVASTLIHGVSGALSSAVRHAEELNDALSDIRVVTGYSTDYMAKFAKEATKAANELSTTVTEYSKAALIFYQQGLSGSAVTERADVVVKLAQVTGMSAESVSDQMTAIWNNFDDGSKSLEYYADVMAKLGAATAASTSEISEGLEKFAAIADTVGLSYETATAAVATVVDKTKQSADVVGTAFKTMFARMEGLSLGETLDDGVDLNKYSQALQTVGINVLNAKGELRDMDSILDELGEKWQYFGDETKVALAQTVGGIRQYNQMIALMDNWDAVEENIELAKNATGELTEQQTIWSESYEAAANRVKQAQNELYEKFINDEAIVKLNDMFAHLIDSVSSFIDTMGGVGPLALMLVGIFSKTLFPLLQSGLRTLKTNIDVLTGKAQKDLIRIQSETSKQLSELMQKNTLMTETQRKQAEITQKLILAKRELALTSKNMTLAQREEAEAAVQNYEIMTAQAQQALEKKAALEEEIKLMKIKMNTGARRKQLGETAALDSFRAEHADDDPDDGIDVDSVIDQATHSKASDTEKALAQLDADEAAIPQQRYELEQKIKSTKQSIAALEENYVNISSQNPEREAATLKKLEERQALLGELEAQLEDINNVDEGRREHLEAVLELQRKIVKETQKDSSKMVVGEVKTAAFTDSTTGQGKEAKTFAKGMAGEVASSLGGKEIGGKDAVGDAAPEIGDIAVGASVENLEKIYGLLGEYRVQLQEVSAMETEFSSSLQEYLVTIDEVADSTTELSAAQQAYDDAVKASGEGSADAQAKLKALEAAQKRSNDAVAKQKKILADGKKAGQDYDKQIKSLEKSLVSMAKKAKVAPEVIEDLEKAFKDLGKGKSTGAVDKIKSTLESLRVASQGTGDGLEEMASDMRNALLEAGYDAESLDALITKLQELGIISPDVANKMRMLEESGGKLGGKPVSGAQKFAGVLTTVGTVAGSVAMSVNMLSGAFMTLTNPDASGLEKVVSVLTTVSMLIPTIAGAITFLNAVKAANNALEAQGIALSGASIGKQLVEMGVISAKTAATWGNTIANIANLLSNPWTMALAAVALVAIAAVVVGLSIHTKNTEANTEAQLENNKAQAESSTKTAELIDKTQELAQEVNNLTSEYEKLSAAGKNTTEVLEGMSEKIPELIAQYRELADSLTTSQRDSLNEMTDDLEHLYNVAQLTGDYSEFNKKKTEIDNFVTQAEYDNAMVGGSAAGTIGADAMVEAGRSGSKRTGNKVNIKLAGSENQWGAGNFFGGAAGSNADNDGNGIPDGLDQEMKNNSKDGKIVEGAEETTAKYIMAKNMGSYFKQGHGAGMFARSTGHIEFNQNSPGEYVEAYEKMQESIREMEETMTDEQLANSGIYSDLKAALEAGKDQYDQMIPLAKAQADAGGKLTEIAMQEEGIAMANVDTLEEYVTYKEAFIQKAKEQYGLTESQAEAYLKEAEGLSRVSSEYELASKMLSNFYGIDIKNVDNDALQALQDTLIDSFGELSDEELSVAVSLAATAKSMDDFSEKMQQSMIMSARQGFEKSAEVAAEAMATAAETGKFSLSNLYNDDNFIQYLEDIGMQQVTLTAASYEEQYRIVSDYYAKLNTLVYDSYTGQQELHYQAIAERQREIAAINALNNNSTKKAEVDSQREDYVELQAQIKTTVDEAEKARLQNQLNEMAASFETTYGFAIDSNVEELQNEMDNLLAQIEELQNKKIEMAMDWSGTDSVEQSLEKTAEFAKLIQKDTKKVGDNYVLTAKQAREWLEFYPELGAIAETTEDGLIEMNADRVKAFLDGNETELDSTIDTKIAELEAQKATLQAELELREIDFKAAQAFAQGELQLEGVSAEYLTQLRSNLTQYYMDLGMDQVEANKAALETMQMNEDQYAAAVAESCENQAQNMAYAAEAGANAQVDSLKQIGEKWKSFGSYLMKNIGPILKDIAAAILDPTKSVKDVMLNAWTEGTKSVSVDVDTSKIKENTSSLDFKSLDQQQITAAYQAVSQQQSESISATIAELQKGIGSIDGQIDYLKALKNQSLEDYGQEGIGTDELDMLEEALERYHEITREIEALERAVDKYSDATARAFGKDKLGLMDKQIEALEELKEKQETLEVKQRADLIDDRKTLESLFADATDENGAAVTIDTSGMDGNIANYTDLVAAAERELNAARLAYNQSAQDEADEEALEAAEEKYEKQIAALEQYEETLDGIAESEETVRDLGYQIQDLNFEKLNTKLELQLEINDSELEKIEYYLDKYADDFYKMAESAALIGGQKSIAESNIAAQEAYMAELDAAKANGEISDADYAAARDEVIASIREELSTLQDLDKEMQDYYGNTLAMAQEELGKHTNKMSQLSTVLDHYSSMLSIVGKETDYATMGVVLQGIADNLSNQVAVAEKEYEWYSGEAEKKRKLYEAAIKAGNQAAADVYKKEWDAAQEAANQAQDNMLSQTEAWADAMKSVIQNKLSDFAKTLEQQLTGGTSFDEMTTSIERAASLQEEYLTTTNQIYETTKMMRTAEKALDETTNTAAKNKLKGFIETTKQLQNQGKLSQYELDMQQAKYDLLLAEIALEEAQNAKSTVRLQRDAEGNFGYVYTADANQVADAQQGVDDAQNALYNKQLEGANDYAQKYQQTLQESQDAVSALTQAYFDGEIATEEEYLRRMEDTKAYYQEKLQSYSELYKVATAEDSAVINEAWSTSFMNTAISAEDWAKSVTDYSNSCGQAFQEWDAVVAEVESTVAGSFGTIADSVSNITSESDALVTAITKDGGVIDALGNEVNAVSAVTTEYAKQREELLALIAAKEKYLYGDTENNTPGLLDASNASKNPSSSTSSSSPEGFDTGGYTGEWGPEGKLAMLHQKEIVLNQDDTANLLSAVEMVRTILAAIDMHSTSAQLGGILSTPGFQGGNSETLEQNVKIEASFPNVQDRNEIEEAFNNLINRASQYANR